MPSTNSNPTLNCLAGLLLALIWLSLLTGPAQADGPVFSPPGQRHYGTEETPPGLSPAEWGQIVARLQQQPYTPVVSQQPGHFQATNPALGWQLSFTPAGLNVQPDQGDWRWGLHLQAYGRAGAMRPVKRASLSAEGQSVIYRWDDNLRELFHNRSEGLKQDFVLAQRPAGAGPLRLAIATPGNLTGHLVNDDSLNFYDAHNHLSLTYSGLHVFDAAGESIPAHFELLDYPDQQSKIAKIPEWGQNLKSKIINIVIDDAAARYPLTIDPIAQQAYLKASNTEADDQFGYSMALSGNTLVVGAYFEDSNATGINGNQADNSASRAGAVYVFTRSGATWTQQAYLKASNTGADDQFGDSVAISGDTVVVGAVSEASSATGINGNQADNSASGAGAVYVFTRSGTTWSQQAYLKASNTGAFDQFGDSVALSGDTLVVGATEEDSNATGVNGNQADNSAGRAGAVYVFTRSGTTWSQQAYLKASNTERNDIFGDSVAISGNTLVVGTGFEDSNATGVNGDQTNNSAQTSGAVYVFTRSGTTWSQQAYLKASNTGEGDVFGRSVAISGDTLVVGGEGEASNATGVNGDQTNNSASGAGAVYVFTRSGTTWSQQGYLKASNTGASDRFGWSVALSGDTLAVGAYGEASNATGVNGNQADNSATQAGAVYVFTRSGTTWSQQAYLKASNTGTGDLFGFSMALSGDTVAVGALGEGSNATGVNGDQTNNSANSAGAAYTFLISPDPEMAVIGNSLTILDGDPSPSLADHTNFGSASLGGAITRTFTIANSGLAALNLTGSPRVAITGPAAGDFSLVSNPITPVGASSTTSFQVRFAPSGAGARVATVTIASNDPDENPYDFAIQGTSSNSAPTANAGNDQSVNTSALVTLNGSASSDPDGHTPLTYRWTQTGGPSVTLSSATATNPTFTAPGNPAVLTFSLTVTDSLGLTDPSPDTVVITVNNQPPLTNAGSDQSVNTSALVTLNGSASSDPDGDTPLTYRWSQTGGPAVSLSSATAVNPTFTAPGNPAVLTFSLIVTDSFGLADATPDTVVITVNNQPPLANAGSDQSVNTSALVTLNGSASSDPDGDTPLTYRWSQTGGPAVTLSSATAVNPTFTAPANPAVITFSLQVTDSFGLADPTPDTVVITVNNQPPVANAGSDQSVNTSALVTLNGSASSDPDGDTPLAYRWSQTGGPAATLSSATAVNPTFAAPATPAVITFSLRVTDSLGLADPTPDTVVITVSNSPITGLTAANSSPTHLGTATAFTATITSGSSVSYLWAFGDGSTGSGANPSHTYSAIGSYTAVVTATNSTNTVTATTLVNITNQPPVANAGSDQSVNTSALVSLNGSASSDPENDLPLSYRWTQTGGPAVTLSSATTVNPTFTAPGNPAVLTFSLRVTDSLGLADPTPDTVVITVNNQPPIANAGSDQSVNTSALVTLNGTGSSDPDNDLPLTYRWTQTGGPVVTLSSATTVNPTLTAPATPAVITFSLRVTDSLGLADPTPDTVVITVSNSPITGLAASNSSPTHLGNVTTFTATITSGSSVSYLWNFGDGGTGSGATPSHTYSVTGSYTAVVTATNGTNTVTATTSVSITNQPPVANAGSDQSVNTSALVTLNGSASSDPDNDLPLTYRWSQTGGPAVTLSSATAVNPTFTAPGNPAVIIFSLRVTDSLGLADATPDTVVITVNNQPPIANAGSDQSVNTSALVTLNGSASSDPDGDTPLTYRWTQTGGPAVTLSSATTVNPTFTAPATPAVLTFTLRVTDSLGLADPTPDTVVVTVSNSPITGLAVSNSSPTHLGNVTAFTATITSGSSVSYIWNFGDGQTGSGANPNHTYSTTGNYTAIVTATNSTNTVTATTSVNITNQPPVANAGSDQSVNTSALVTLNGSASSDPDGDTPLTYGWTQVGGPAVTLSSAITVNPTFTAPATPTVITFSLRVTDSLGLTDPTPDIVVITVSNSPITGLAAANSSPTHLGNATTFIATITGGSNVSYTWAFGDGSTGAGAISNHTYSATGSYTAIVTATNSIDTVTETTVVTITNTAPNANAGPDQGVNVGTLVNLDGSASSDPDGDTPLTYRWTQTGSPAVTLSSATAASPTFIAPATSAVITFTLRVTDSLGLADPTPDTVVVTVNNSPITGLAASNSGPTHLGNATAFTATITGGNNVSYLWAFGDGSTGVGANPSHIYSATGNYTAIVTATNSVNTVTATTLVSITNTAPNANAGSDQSANSGTVVTLDGTGSSDPDNDLPLTFGWSQIGGPAVTLSDSTASQPTFTTPGSSAVLTFSLRVTDSLGLAAPSPDTVVVAVSSNSPSSQSLYLPLIFRGFTGSPDLVITSLTASSNGVTVVIENIGNAPVSDAFWVDLYFNPSQTPQLNQPWNTIAGHGAVWGVTGDGLSQLTPGGALTLTAGDTYYFASESSPLPFPDGLPVYGLVDSINHATSYGAVQERNEANNLFGPVLSSATAASKLPAATSEPAQTGLPQR